MAELKISTDEVVGIKKEIEEGSLELIFNALQSDIYSFPIKSFVRETISNGLDSIIERGVFRAIESGEPISKYFKQRQDGALLKDSEYDKNYYRDSNLSIDEKVYVEYKEGSPRDKIIIKDNGVGLGNTRLRGFFKLGFSSKRNFFTARGLFGLGSKSALATGVEYFLMTTVYNGFKTSFMIYNRDYENITPETPGGKIDVWSVVMANDQVIDKNIYWAPTNELNSVTIEVEVKKHNKKTFISAVKDQFQYFNGAINLKIFDLYGGSTVDNLNDTPEYESDNLLIPKYSTYSSPHILVDGISYGLVSWEELELETRRGKIALKVSANDVDITQSRETLKWTDKTKKAILNSITKAEDEASDFVRANIEIDDVDNVFALNDAYSNLSDSASASVTNTFSKFLALHSIRPKYVIDLGKDKIKAVLSYQLFDFLFYSYDFKRVTTYTEGTKLKIKNETVREFDSISGNRLVYGDEASLGPKLASHLMNKFNVTSLIYIRENNTRVKSVIALTKVSKDYKASVIADYAKNLIKKYSDLYLDNYEITYDESDNLDDVELEDTKVNQATQRKMNKEVMWYDYRTTYTYGQVQMKRQKEVCKISDLQTIMNGKDIIVVPSTYQKLGKMLVTLENLKASKKTFKVVFVSDDNSKHFMLAGGIHITNYFRTLNEITGELMIGEKLIELNTAYQYKKLRDKFSSFSSCSQIICDLSPLIKSKYDSFDLSGDFGIKETMEQATGNDEAIVDEILTYLDTLSDFQNCLITKDKDIIAKKALELFNTDKIHNIYAYDKDYIDSVEVELERLSIIAPLIESLATCNSASIPLLKILVETLNKSKNN